MSSSFVILGRGVVAYGADFGARGLESLTSLSGLTEESSDPQGLKPTSVWALTARLEAVPFPNPKVVGFLVRFEFGPGALRRLRDSRVGRDGKRDIDGDVRVRSVVQRLSRLP